MHWMTKKLYLRDTGALLFELLLLRNNALLLSQNCHPLSSFSIRIQLQQNIKILKRIFLNSTPLNLLLNRLHHGLNLIGVNNPSQVSIHKLRPRQHITLLLLRTLLECSIDRIEFLESRFSPNHKTT
ncbi:hypothetical protein Lal_00032986 [Lupinus albus]|nr:hypothetical protein Lal_00032986 [Lupinus albus]